MVTCCRIENGGRQSTGSATYQVTATRISKQIQGQYP